MTLDEDCSASYENYGKKSPAKAPTLTSRKPSPNCANCRRVKRRCDEKRPSCGQCVRTGQNCHGYRDKWELIFRDQTKDTVQRANEINHTKKNQSSHGSLTVQGKSQRPALLQTPVLFQAVASGSVIGSQMFSSYLDHYFPRQVSPLCALDSSYLVFSGIYKLPQKSQMLRKACSALSCVFLGKIHKDEPLLRYGIHLYNQAIYEMSKAINLKDNSADIIYTCAIFAQIETHYCPDSLDKWYAHLDGLSALMNVYYVQKKDSALITIIYDQHQKFKVLLSRFMHLSEPIVKWLREPGEGLLYELIQILTDLSCLVATVDSAKGSLDYDAYTSLLDDCLALEERHLRFYSKISDSDNGTYKDPPTYDRGKIKSRIPATDDLFGPAYIFISVGQANLHILIWTSLSLVHPLIYQVYTLAKDVSVPKVLQNNSIDDQRPRDVAHQLSASYICKAMRCLPYCTQEGMNPWAIFYGIFSAVQASRVYSHIRDRERFLWALVVVQFIARSGFDLAAQLLQPSWSYWFETERHNSYRLPFQKEVTKEYRGSAHEGYGREIPDTRSSE